jgi:predicted site-specific integrase-resolvase
MSEINQQTKPESLLDRRALANHGGCSIETLKRREKDGTLTPIYLPGGRLVRYRLSEILKLEGQA